SGTKFHANFGRIFERPKFRPRFHALPHACQARPHAPARRFARRHTTACALRQGRFRICCERPRGDAVSMNPLLALGLGIAAALSYFCYGHLEEPWNFITPPALLAATVIALSE